MSIFWFVAISLHILAAITWIGGMIFLSLVLVPLVKRDDSFSRRAVPFREIALRFRVVVWVSIAVLLTTGPLLIVQRGLAFAAPSGWPPLLVSKLALVGVLLVLTVLHDLVLGPRVAKIMKSPAEARTPLEQILVRSSAWLPRLSLVVALVLLYTAVLLARS